jgi:hypothetical protein
VLWVSVVVAGVEAHEVSSSLHTLMQVSSVNTSNTSNKTREHEE